MTSPHPLETDLLSAWPRGAWQDVNVLAAVSGGADSVALLRAMVSLKTGGTGQILAAHYNHGLRGGESDGDEAFVVELCRRLHVPCEVGRAEGGLVGKQPGRGLETAARTARYEFLASTAARRGARYVLTAHTADDQAETILHRILRGTGIRGLKGIARARPLGPATLLRPLLAVRRDALRAYLQDVGQEYRHDSSNDDVRLTRNRIRRQLLPELATHFNSHVVEALLRLGTLAGQAQTAIEQVVDELAQRYVVLEDCCAARIDAAGLCGQQRYVIRELLIGLWRAQGWPMQAMGFDQWDLLARMVSVSAQQRGNVQAECPAEVPRKKVFPGGVLAEAQNGELRLVRGGT